MTNNNDNNNIARKLHTGYAWCAPQVKLTISISTWPQLFKRWIVLCDDLWINLYSVDNAIGFHDYL